MASIVQIILEARNQTAAGVNGARSNLSALAATSDRTAQRTQVLTDRIRFQERSLDLLGRSLDTARGKKNADVLAIERQQLRYDQLTATLQRNRTALQQLQAQENRGGVPGGSGQITRSFDSVTGAIGRANSALGAFGVYLGAQQVVQFGLDAGRMANQLEFTETRVKQLSRSSVEYARTLQLARSNQRLFGGSLDENLQGMQGMLLLSRQTNAEMGMLNRVSQQLAIKSPEQGSSGAAIALTEALTGKGAESTRSLQLRYEFIPEVLQKIQRAKDPTEKLRLISQALTDQGASSETLNAQLDTTAQKYRDLGIAWDEFKIKFGGGLADIGAPGASWLTDVLGGVQNDPLKLQTAARSVGMGRFVGSGGSAFGGTNDAATRRPNFGSWQRVQNVISPQTSAPVTAPIAVTSPVAAPVAPQATGTRFGGFGAPVNVYVSGGLIASEEVKAAAERGRIESERRNGDTGYR